MRSLRALISSLILAACATTTPRPRQGVSFDELGCTSRDGSASCRFVHGRGVGCCALQADGTEARFVCAPREAPPMHFAHQPELVAGLVGVAEVEPGLDHLCARMLDGTVRCLGLDRDGELARGTYPASDAITAVGVWAPTASGTGVLRVGKGGDTSCALMGDGAVHCRANASGKLVGPECEPREEGDRYVAHCSGLEPASLCGASPVALRVPGLEHVQALFGDCALLADRSLRCWGRNDQGQLGFAPSYGIPVPSEIPKLGDVRQVVGTCAVGESSGRVECWGKTRDPALAQLDDVEELVLDPQGGCARIRGHVKCWGTNQLGELGVEPADAETHPPTLVPELEGALLLATGGAFRCALVDGRVLCWGRNDQGQLGDGTLTARATPRAVAGLVNAKRLAVGGNQACAIDAEGAVWCWGLVPDPAPNGLRGRATPLPRRIDGFGRAARIAAGGGATCVVTRDTRVACWGAVFAPPERVSGVARPAPSHDFRDDDLFPRRTTPADRLECSLESAYCVAQSCFSSEDECLDERGQLGASEHCVERRYRSFVRRDGAGRVRGQCVCAGDECHVLGSSDAPCSKSGPPLDPETERPLEKGALEAACVVRLVSKKEATPSSQRTRYCATLTERVPIPCSCPPPPPNAPPDTCRCPTPPSSARRCFASAAACEKARALSAKAFPSTTDARCAKLLP